MKRTFQSGLLSLGTVVALVGVPAAAHAQQAPDTRWLPWLGCWQPTAETPVPANLLVCLRPTTDAAGVEVVTIADGQTVSQRTLVADNQPHELNEQDCSGWQRAAFSTDGRRAFLRSDMTCQGGVHRTASAIMAMGTPTEWLDAQAVGMDGERVPRVMHYRVAETSRWPEGFALTPQRSLSQAEARVLAAGQLSLADVREASSKVDRDALVAFLIERGQPFDVDAANLESLAAAGVPDQVIDVVVAVSFPDKFHIDRQAMRMALKPEQRPAKQYAERHGYYDPFGWGYYGGCYYGSFYCSPYSYGLYGFGLGLYSPYGYGYGYGYGPYGYGYVGQPIIVLGNPAVAQPQGQAINGRGYTRGGQPAGTSGGRTAHPRGSTSQSSSGSEWSGGRRAQPTVSRPASAPRAGSGGYTRGGSSSSSGSRGTARPRCCSE